MIILKFILGFTLLVLASVNHFIIYSTRCDIGNLLNYLSLRRVEVYIALGLFALIFQLIIGFYNLLGKLDQLNSFNISNLLWSRLIRDLSQHFNVFFTDLPQNCTWFPADVLPNASEDLLVAVVPTGKKIV